MRTIWAAIAATWGLFAVLAVLAWTRPQVAAPTASIPAAVVVKGKNGQTHLVVVQGGWDRVARDDAHLACRGRMIAAQTAGVPIAWLVARAAGLMALALLTVSVTLGLALSTKLLGGRRGKLLLGWHQTLMWTAVAMLGLHGGALAIDPVMRFGFVGVLVPGAAPWRPVPVAAGIVTGWLMLALAASFHVRKRIGQRRWRLLHYASFGAFAIGLYHALNVGTDLVGTRGLIVAGVFAAPVVWLTFARILMPRAGARPAPPRAAPPPVQLQAQAPREAARVTVPA